MSPASEYALSIKQPWAALVVHGLKTVEVRRWPTARRRRFLIHAARIPDERAEAWKHVRPEVRETAKLLGGIIGAVRLSDCVAYRSLDEFMKDAAAHLNEAEWYEEPLLYGFSFTNAEVLPFRTYPGWMRFFPVKDGPFQRRR